MKTFHSCIAGLLFSGMLLTASEVEAQGRGFHGGGGFGGGFREGGGGYYAHPVYRGGFGFGFGYNRLGYYNAFPAIGMYFNTLPYGYYNFIWGSNPYYYYGGNFYQPYNNGYRVVDPPVGASVPKLPSGASTFSMNGNKYYEANGVYYQKYKDENGKKAFKVVGKNGIMDNASQAQPNNQQGTSAPRGNQEYQQ